MSSGTVPELHEARLAVPNSRQTAICMHVRHTEGRLMWSFIMVFLSFLVLFLQYTKEEKHCQQKEID